MAINLNLGRLTQELMAKFQSALKFLPFNLEGPYFAWVHISWAPSTGRTMNLFWERGLQLVLNSNGTPRRLYAVKTKMMVMFRPGAGTGVCWWLLVGTRAGGWVVAVPLPRWCCRLGAKMPWTMANARQLVCFPHSRTL